MDLEYRINAGSWLPLADLGASSIVRRQLSRAPSSLAIDIPVAQWTQDAALAIDDTLTLRRLVPADDPVTWFVGRVVDLGRRTTGTSEAMRVSVEDAWWDLENLPFTQSLASLTVGAEGSVFDAPSNTPVAMSRGLIGVDADGERLPIAGVIQAVISYAAGKGVALQAGTITEASYIPAFSARDLTCAQIILRMIETLPDLVTEIDPTTSPPSLHVRPRASLPTATVTAGPGDLASADIRPRYDLQREGVIIYYELAGLSAEGEPAVRIHEEKFPTDHSLSLRTHAMTIEADDRGGSFPGEDPAPPFQPPQITWHTQRVKTRTVPAANAVDNAAKRWWALRIPGLARYKAIVDWDSIVIPAAAAGDPDEGTDIVPHSVAVIDDQADDPPGWQFPDDPNAPVAPPPDPADYPRELVGGAIADWMPPSIIQAPCVATATIALPVATIAAIADAGIRGQFERFFSRAVTIGGVACRAQTLSSSFTGTNATTRVYRGVASYDPGWGADEGEGDRPQFPEPPPVGLAQRIYDALNPLQWEGSWALVDPAAMAANWIGRRFNITATARPEWASMNAQVVDVTIDLAAETTTLRFGPHGHIEPETAARLQRMGHRLQPNQRRDALTYQEVAAPTYSSVAPVDEDNPVLGSYAVPAANTQPEGGAAGGAPQKIAFKLSVAPAETNFLFTIAGAHSSITDGTNGDAVSLAGIVDTPTAIAATKHIVIEATISSAGVASAWAAAAVDAADAKEVRFTDGVQDRVRLLIGRIIIADGAATAEQACWVPQLLTTGLTNGVNTRVFQSHALHPSAL